MKPRPYQEDAIKSCVLHFEKGTTPGLCVLPTGAGKSIVIAKTAEAIKGNLLVFQPSKEILEQNIAKFRALGHEASIYSASMGEKEISKVTFATIGSVFNQRLRFGMFQNVMIDEAHGVDGKQGQYNYFLNNQPELKCVGLTATPYRMRQEGRFAITEFLTRTVPAFFKEVIHVTQQEELREQGFLSPIQYKRCNEINTDNLRVKGMEYEESSVLKEYQRVGIDDLIIQEIELLEKTPGGILVFVEFIEILEKIKAKRPDLEYVTGETPKEERERLLSGFKSGAIKTLLNVGVLTTGFDHPPLSKIIIAKATRSLSLWYQMIGRGQRIATGKEDCLVVDMCNNLKVLGDPQQIKVVQHNGKWVVKINHRIITNRAL